MVYDKTCTGRIVGLSTAWAVGGALYAARGWLHARRGASSFEEALEWLGSFGAPAPIAEVQFWGHGKWGDIRIGDERLDEGSLSRSHEHARRLSRLGARLAPESLVWLRTCETFGANRGQSFARALSDRLGCHVAGHTYVIDVWQSGLHALAPGAAPTWAPDEGLTSGTPAAPSRARRSTPSEPNTISCFEGKLPSWARD